MTSGFKMGAGRYVGEMVYRHGRWALLVPSLLAVAGLVLGLTVDYRWLIVMLMVIFILAPMLLALMYFYFGLRRESYVNTSRHCMEVTEEGLLMWVQVKPLPDDENEEPEFTREEWESCHRKEFFAYDQMLPMESGLNSVNIPLKAPAKGFLWIPVSAFEDSDEAEATLMTIEKSIEAKLQNDRKL